VFPLEAVGSMATAYLTDAPDVFRFSQPLDVLTRLRPAVRISEQIRSWGLALQSFAPLVQQCTVSSVLALLSFAIGQRGRQL
jgi:hypothetical protein